MLFINYGEEVQKILYQVGFDKKQNHGIWKLKIRLNKNEWEYVKEYFNYYEENMDFLSNMSYYGWGTTRPVDVVRALFSLKD